MAGFTSAALILLLVTTPWTTWHGVAARYFAANCTRNRDGVFLCATGVNPRSRGVLRGVFPVPLSVSICTGVFLCLLTSSSALWSAPVLSGVFSAPWSVSVPCGVFLCFVECSCAAWSVSVPWNVLCTVECFSAPRCVPVLNGVFLCSMGCFCAPWSVTVLHGVFLCSAESFCTPWSVSVPCGVFLYSVECSSSPLSVPVLYGVFLGSVECSCAPWSVPVSRGVFLCASGAAADAEVGGADGLDGWMGCALSCTLDDQCRHFNHVPNASMPCQLFYSYGANTVFAVIDGCQHYHAPGASR